MTTASYTETISTKRRRSGKKRRENLYGYLFLTPWLIGFFALFLGPGLASVGFSFTKYDVLSPPQFIGLQNYIKMFTEDDLFWPSLVRTFYYAGVGVPLGVMTSMILAILLNTKVKGVTVFRTLFFMPSLVPLVASAVLWTWLLNTDFGILNQALRSIGIDSAWLVQRPQVGDTGVDLYGLVARCWRDTHDYFPGRSTRHSRCFVRCRSY